MFKFVLYVKPKGQMQDNQYKNTSTDVVQSTREKENSAAVYVCRSVVRVVCQVQVCATSWSLIQRSPTTCGVSNCVWSRKLKNEAVLARVGLLSQRERNLSYSSCSNCFRITISIQSISRCYIPRYMNSNTHRSNNLKPKLHYSRLFDKKKYRQLIRRW
jgi:hypothetical protein